MVESWELLSVSWDDSCRAQTLQRNVTENVHMFRIYDHLIYTYSVRSVPLAVFSVWYDADDNSETNNNARKTELVCDKKKRTLLGI